MPFIRPTLPALRTRARAYLAARLNSDPALDVGNIPVIADVLAEFVSGEYGYLAGLIEQSFVSSQVGGYLDRSAGVRGIPPRIAPTLAFGTAQASGTNGYTVPAAVQLLAPDGVTLLQTTAPATISGGVATLFVQAITTGSGANLPAGTALSLVVADANLAPAMTVLAPGLSGGTPLETDAQIRARVLADIQTPGAGGAWSDYRAWTLAAGVGATRVWVYPLNRGPGTVDVAFVCDGRTNNIPLSPDIAAVLAYMAPLIPVTANRKILPPSIDGFVFAPTPSPVPIVLNSLVPNTPLVQANIAAALADLFGSAATPGGATYGDGVDANHPAGFLPLERIVEAIADAGGVISFDLAAPSADVTMPAFNIATLGPITY